MSKEILFLKENKELVDYIRTKIKSSVYVPDFYDEELDFLAEDIILDLLYIKKGE